MGLLGENGYWFFGVSGFIGGWFWVLISKLTIYTIAQTGVTKFLKKFHLGTNSISLRILHVAAAVSWRGGEQQLAYLIETLHYQGVAQWVLCAKGSPVETWCREKGVVFFTFKKKFSAAPHPAFFLNSFCRQVSATHVHVHDSHAHTMAFLSAVLFGNKTPLIVHRRVDFPIGGNFFSKWKYNHRRIAAIICVSHFIAKVIQPQIRQPSKIFVVHSGIDLHRFQREKPAGQASLRAAFGLPNDAFLIGNIAAVAPHKDYFTFVKTAAILAGKGLNAKYLIIGGDGGDEAAVRRFIEVNGLKEQVILTGFRKDIAQVLPQLDLLLFTSKTEGLGTTLLDAFACGVPVVATAAGGIPEIVAHGETGFLAPVGDAAGLAGLAEKILKTRSVREKIIANARLSVNAFSKEKMAGAIKSIYIKTLSFR